MQVFLISLITAALTLSLPVAIAATTHDKSPTVINRVEPNYPSDAETKRVSGTVGAVLTVTPAGTVQKVSIQSETPEGYGFALAATEAFWQWTFEAGQPGEFYAAVNFKPRHAYTPAEMAALPELPAASPAPRYPSKARREGVNGIVEAVVELNDSGAVKAFEVVSERPVNYRFAYAAAVAFEGQIYPKAAAGAYRAKVLFDHATATPELRPNASKVVKYPRPVTVIVTGKKAVRKNNQIVGTVDLLVEVSEWGRAKAIEVVRQSPAGQDMAGEAIETVEIIDVGPGEPVTYAITVNFKRP